MRARRATATRAQAREQRPQAVVAPDTRSMPTSQNAPLTADDLNALLAVTRALAAPFDLHQMLVEVAAAACRVLHAERASVWLLDEAAGELVLEVAADLGPLRLPLGTGLVGRCALERRIVNVADCYADPRFNRSMDLQSGYRTRCLLATPLVDDRGRLVGVMQVLNRHDGVFEVDDEPLAEALAAQCAVALSRVRMADAMVAGELLRQEVELASAIQRSTLPPALPVVPGYALHGFFRPASSTGGDAYDLALIDQGLLVVLADATGHGVAAALSVTQMHAMVRVALGIGADLPTMFRAVNNRLADTLPDGRFVTAFIGLLDPATHTLRYISGGQGPILHWHADGARCTAHRANSFPMGAMPLPAPRAAVEMVLAPGDWLVLLSDGFYEYEDAGGRPFGRAGVERVVQRHAGDPAATMTDALLSAVREHAAGAAQLDDMTLVLVRRLPLDPVNPALPGLPGPPAS